MDIFLGPGLSLIISRNIFRMLLQKCKTAGLNSQIPKTILMKIKVSTDKNLNWCFHFNFP